MIPHRSHSLALYGVCLSAAIVFYVLLLCGIRRLAGAHPLSWLWGDDERRL